ncbi:hypothetical protein ABZS66_55855 [Dactylosporangium sp. NPDC005572]|uniref:hypothetical protein n=1 Tax=Dactylosporangium sp. NPDC005572 TaxID=3156889 RepID=UPI0033A57EE0
MRVAQLHRPLIVVAALMAALAIGTAAGIALDDRTLLGVPVWLKPFKFAVSIAIYSVTFAWLISLLDDRRKRLGWWVGTVTAGTMLAEMVIIVGQAGRGHQSHFNNQTPLDATLYSVMGATIGIAWLCTAFLAVLLLIQRLPDRPAALAVRFGLLVGLGGMGVGFLMTLPTKAQLDSDSDIIGAHAVGVADGGAGIPLVNWSTTGGDLRAGHFIGMHALQALPLLAFGLVLLSRRFARLRADRVRARLITVAGIAYAGLTVLITWQALRGQSIAHPDGLTLGAFGVLMAFALLGTLWAVRVPAAVADDRVPAGVV